MHDEPIHDLITRLNRRHSGFVTGTSTSRAGPYFATAGDCPHIGHGETERSAIRIYAMACDADCGRKAVPLA